MEYLHNGTHQDTRAQASKNMAAPQARPAPSTRNRPLGRPTRPGATRRKPRHPEKPPLPHPLPPAVKSKCRVSLSRGSVRFERGGPRTGESGREMGYGKGRARRKPAGTGRSNRSAPGAHLHQKAWERSPGAPASAPELPRRPAGQVRGAFASKMVPQIAPGSIFIDF